MILIVNQLTKCVDPINKHLFTFYLYRLREALEIYEDQNEKQIKAESITKIPDTVLLKHIIHFWKAVSVAYQKKKDEV